MEPNKCDAKGKPRDGIFLSKQTIDKLLRQRKSSDLISLYIFYCYTGLWQQTNKPKATIDYVGKGLNWGVKKVRQVKNALAQLGFVEDICVFDKGTRRVSEWYVHIRYFHPVHFGEDGFSTLPIFHHGGTGHSVESESPNALRAVSTRHFFEKKRGGTDRKSDSVPAHWHEFIREAYPKFKGDYRHAPEYIRNDFAKARKKPASISARYGIG